jgi:ABC-type iron transport system FetAB ATPase subunit
LQAALFRLVEYEPSGCVRIDGVPTRDVGTRLLRSSISVIPQEPVLFSGSVRSNLDPFNQHDDDTLWTALVWPMDQHRPACAVGESLPRTFLNSNVLEMRNIDCGEAVR